MGKYMKKSQTSSDTSVMKVSEPTSMGVRTRAAKTLALKRLNSSNSTAGASALADDDSCYLQLRSRRLEKLVSLSQPKQLPKHQQSGIKESRVDSVSSEKTVSDSVSVAQSCNGDSGGDYVSAEASFGENNLDFESRHSTRESTPCNYVEDQEIIVTPGSSMRSATRDDTRNRDITDPITAELEEFFAYAEEQQQRLFMAKYNFDIVNDMPVTGRYEWVQVNP